MKNIENWHLLALGIVKRCTDDYQEKEMNVCCENIPQLQKQAEKDLENGGIDWLLELLKLNIDGKELKRKIDEKEIHIVL